MTRTRTLARALSGGVILVLAAAGLVVGAVVPASAATTLVYDSIPEVSPPSYTSVGFQATDTKEFGDYVQLGGTDRAISEVTVGLTNWGCENWQNPNPCVTTPGSSYLHPITLNLYEVDNSGATPVVGDVIVSVTEDKAIPYRPSASVECGDNRWSPNGGINCYNGYAFNLTFDLTSVAPFVGDDVVVGIAFNTQTRGYAPIGQPGPYNSLNVSYASAPPTVGTNETQDEAFRATGAGSFVAASGYGAHNGLVLEIAADDSLIPAPTQDVTVYQKDVKPSETAETYLDWHEGRTNATPAYSVQPDGLHLGTTAASNIVKGTDIPNSEVSKAELRALILGNASVDVVSGEGSFGIPLGFGTALTAGNYKFTTLHTDISPGVNEFTLSDTWRTSQALFSDYIQLEEDTLENYLDYIYAGGKKVWLFGYNVQSNGPSVGAPLVVESLTWDDTSYTFFQPVTEACTPSGGYTVTNLDGAGWTFSESRAQSTTVFTADGLSLTTYGTAAGSPDPRKAAGYVDFAIDLADVGVPELNLGAISGPLQPSIQLVTDFDGDDIADGILVGESVYNGDYWVPNSAAAFVKAAAPSHTTGFGSTNHGTLDQWLVSFPEARVLKVGYSLGSGPSSSAVIESIVVGCQTISFEADTLDAATNEVSVRELDIRPNEATYPGWHEGYANPARAFTVQDDGLHLGDGNHSQILNGFDAPLLTTDLESYLTGAEVVLVDGSVTLQVPVVYGPTNKFTTLRSQSLAIGENGVSVTDRWVSTQKIYGADGVTQLVDKNVPLTVADFSALLHSIGAVNIIGFGVQADTSAVVESIRWDDTVYSFEPYASPVTSTVYVYEPEIRPNENTYPGWHEGYANATQSYQVTEDGLTLGSPLNSQIIKGLDAPLTTPSVAELITGASVEVADGSITLQVPIFYGAGTDFLTLRSVGLSEGTHAFTLSSQWASTRAVPSLGIIKHQPMPLGDLLDKLTNVRVLGFGVQADTAATVTAIVFNQTEYRFDGVIETGIPVITGTAMTAETLTANPGTWTPSDATLSYQWLADGEPIDGASGATYVVDGAYVGASITVAVTGSSPGYASDSATSAAVTPVAATLTTQVPYIAGTAAIGSVLTAHPGTWGPAPVSFDYQWLSNGVPVPGATGVTYLITYSNAGKSLTVVATGSKLGYTSVSVASPPTLSLPTNALPAVARLAGDSRYETAVAVSQGFAPGVSRVYLSVGTNYPDALSAAAAAAHLDAPVLLTLPDVVPDVVLDELERLEPSSIVVTGSEASVSAAVVTQLEALDFGPEVIRIGGNNRYETSRMIAREAFGEGTTDTTYFTNGTNFPDALAAAPAAATFDGPVILVSKFATMPDSAILSTLEYLGVENIKLAGDYNAITLAFEEALEVDYTVVRNQGANRFLTAAAINEDAFESASTIYLATGLKFPDALAGAARAGSEGAALFPTLDTCIPPGVLDSIIDLNPSNIILLGSEASLSRAIEDLTPCS